MAKPYAVSEGNKGEIELMKHAGHHNIVIAKEFTISTKALDHQLKKLDLKKSKCSICRYKKKGEKIKRLTTRRPDGTTVRRPYCKLHYVTVKRLYNK